MKNLLKILSISAIAVNVFADDVEVSDPDGIRLTTASVGTITDVSNVSSDSITVGGVTYDNLTLQGHGLKVAHSMTIADSDGTVLLLKAATEDDLSTSAVFLINGSSSNSAILKISSDITVENIFKDAWAMYLGWKGQVTIDAGVTVKLADGEDSDGNTLYGNLFLASKANSTYLTNNGTLYVGGNFEMDTGGNGTTFTNNGTFTVMGTTAIKSNNFNLNSGSTSTFTGDTTISGGIATINSGATATFESNVTISGGTVNISSSNIDFEKMLILSSGTLNLLSGSDFDIYSSDSTHTVYNRFIVSGSSVLNVLDDDVLADKELYLGGTTLTLGFSNGTTTVADNTNVSIGSVYLHDASANFTIDMSSLVDSTDVTISIGDIASDANFATITIDGFLNNLLQISELADTSYDIVGEIVSGVASTTVTIDGYLVNLSVEVGDLTGNEFIFDSDGFLSFGGVVVPEPSTYAMIFGAIALGLAVYRRRK